MVWYGAPCSPFRLCSACPDIDDRARGYRHSLGAAKPVYGTINFYMSARPASFYEAGRDNVACILVLTNVFVRGEETVLAECRPAPEIQAPGSCLHRPAARPVAARSGRERREPQCARW